MTLQDAVWAAAQPWLYAVLDEGHVIKNSRSKVAQVRWTRGARPCHHAVCRGCVNTAAAAFKVILADPIALRVLCCRRELSPCPLVAC